MSIFPARSFLSELTEPWIWLCFDHGRKVWQQQCSKPRLSLHDPNLGQVSDREVETQVWQKANSVAQGTVNNGNEKNGYRR